MTLRLTTSLSCSLNGCSKPFINNKWVEIKNKKRSPAMRDCRKWYLANMPSGRKRRKVKKQENGNYHYKNYLRYEVQGRLLNGVNGKDFLNLAFSPVWWLRPGVWFRLLPIEVPSLSPVEICSVFVHILNSICIMHWLQKVSLWLEDTEPQKPF